MRVLLADEDNERQVRRLYERLLRDPWREFALDIGLQRTEIAAVGLPRGSSDRTVWQTCQKLGLILVTGNRNQDGPDSLEQTLRDSNDVNCLPVLTIGNVRRLLEQPDYAERTAEKLLEYVYDLERHVGAGRLYIP